MADIKQPLPAAPDSIQYVRGNLLQGPPMDPTRRDSFRLPERTLSILLNDLSDNEETFNAQNDCGGEFIKSNNKMAPITIPYLRD